MSDAIKDEPILLELRPKRAIVVACLFSSVSIVIAIGYLVQTMLTIDTTGTNYVLLQVTIAILVAALCSAVVVNYARRQPPLKTRLWSMPYSVVGYLAILWLLLCAFTFVVTSNVLSPKICSTKVDPECDADYSSLAFQTFLVRNPPSAPF
ncbi:hypothetical protein JCM3766R1_005120 [Sporobolomyces carnicolor]